MGFSRFPNRNRRFGLGFFFVANRTNGDHGARPRSRPFTTRPSDNSHERARCCSDSQEPTRNSADVLPEGDEPTVVKEVEKTLDWSKHDRDQALMAQVAFAGQKAWLTQKANVKPNKVTGRGGQTYKQKEVWMNKKDGIVPMIAKHEAFAGAPLPTEEPTAVINHVHSLLKKFAFLYTPGREQDEPAPAGTEGTKDESPITALKQARARTI